MLVWDAGATGGSPWEGFLDLGWRFPAGHPLPVAGSQNASCCMLRDMGHWAVVAVVCGQPACTMLLEAAGVEPGILMDCDSPGAIGQVGTPAFVDVPGNYCWAGALVK